ncbi:MAG: hypothetical protein LWX83_03465 [Anaerolineae bacterium]|nr:hypothetical protein [Anaerolineae bacterium]
MKTLVIGSGIIGTIYAWALIDAGIPVTHYMRPGKSEFFAKGVTLDVLDERKGHPTHQKVVYTPHCTESISPEDGYELIIVPVNAQQLSAVLQELAPRSGQALFLILTSNWQGTDAIDAFLPRERYLLGYADGGGTQRDGVYWTNLGAEIHLGLTPGAAAEKLERVKSIFEKADMRPDIQNNILNWLWVHNATVIGFAAGFARHQDMQAYLKDTQLLKKGVLASRELLSLCELRGVNLKDYPEISYFSWPDWMIVTIMRWMFNTNKSMQRYTAHASSRSSMLESCLHFQNMLKTAHELNVAAPALESLAEYFEAYQ